MTIVDAGHRKPMEIEVVVPVEDMAELGGVLERPGPAEVQLSRERPAYAHPGRRSTRGCSSSSGAPFDAHLRERAAAWPSDWRPR